MNVYIDRHNEIVWDDDKELDRFFVDAACMARLDRLFMAKDGLEFYGYWMILE